MQLKKTLLSALALASTSLAIDCNKDAKISSDSDLQDLGSCSTFKGDITIQGDGVSEGTVSGLKKIEGSLIIKNATKLSKFTATDLEEISDKFDINVATILNHLEMPKLEKVGKINWITLPALSGLNFDKKVTDCKEVVISDTGLNSLEGINVEKIGTFNVNNNKYLEEVDVDVKSVSNSLDISFNAKQVSASFPQLIWANNITFRDVSDVYLPNLTDVNSSLGFINNTIKGIQCPKLKELGGSLSIVSNEKLTNVSFPKLTKIDGGFQIANNTKLKSILGFPKVKSVGGAIDFDGNFNAAQVPSLDLVKGGVHIDSKSDKFNCTSWDKKHKEGDIHGDSYVCKAKKHSTSVRLTGSNTAGSSDSEETGSSSSDGGAVAISYEYSPVLGAFAAFLFQYV
ncbi:hypothetical protein TRICI_002452 [Trichomonascus ciferrii]|uniref:Receptor L-domain domain-containing protein n=1 Tax=Trichomonascus ciferrii TaxID=44093 RepID=A0A642V7X9_9ASCO|nr:hypothetical protein TRICI_002452 [Trichomonascus ciferrii]